MPAFFVLQTHSKTSCGPFRAAAETEALGTAHMRKSFLRPNIFAFILARRYGAMKVYASTRTLTTHLRTWPGIPQRAMPGAWASPGHRAKNRPSPIISSWVRPW